MCKVYQNYISGSWCDSDNGSRFDNINPADHDDHIGSFPISKAADMNRAVEAARSAFDSWRLTPPPVRGEIMRRAADLMASRKDDLARLETREMGKTLIETHGDVQEGIDTAYFAFGQSTRLNGETIPSELPDKFCITTRMPLGVVGLIT
ncbi:aldehyde dehydrogenase family protein, partial [Candidatus Neomarinimicrobiota bacterium]